MLDLFGNEVTEVKKVRKDWTGDTHGVFVTVGSSNHSKEERQKEDFYATDPVAAEWLLKLEKIEGPIWEPCCGNGCLSKVFEDNGYEVKSTDLVDRGYGQGGVDFLSSKITEWGGAIVTNPPFSIAQEIIEKALSIIPVGQKVCMFLRVLFLEGQKRRKLFNENPPKRVWVASKRIQCAKNGAFDKVLGAAQAYAWFVWYKGFKGDPIIKWFN